MRTGRPETAEKLCGLLGVNPLALRTPREDDAGRVAGQAFVVVLDTIISLGDRGARLTHNTLFDALAEYWSIQYRHAQQRGARISYDMRRSTFRRGSRELLKAGVNVEALWDLLVSQVVPLSGAQVLAHAITYVGAEWLSGVGRIPDPDKPLRYFTAVPPDETRPGLAVVYDWFADSLKGSPHHDFALQIRSRWRERVAAGRWPRFTAS